MIKNILSILIILVLADMMVFGQDEIRKKQFLIGGFVSPGISVPYFKSDLNDFYVPGFSYNLGVEALLQIRSKFSMSFGLQYGYKNTKTKEIKFWGSGYAGPIPGEPTSVRYSYQDHYLEIPIRVDFYLSKRKIAPIITTGISTNMFMKEKVRYTNFYEDGRQEKHQYYNNNTIELIHLELQLGMGVDIALSKTRLRIFPIYKRSGYYNSFQLGINYFFGV